MECKDWKEKKMKAGFMEKIQIELHFEGSHHLTYLLSLPASFLFLGQVTLKSSLLITNLYPKVPSKSIIPFSALFERRL